MSDTRSEQTKQNRAQKNANGYCKVRHIVAVVFIFITLLYIELLLFPARIGAQTSFSYHDPSLAFGTAFRQMERQRQMEIESDWAPSRHHWR